MAEKENKERVIIFIDGSNIYHILKNLFSDKKPNDFNFEKFVNYISRERKLVRTYYYNAPLDREKDKNNYIKQQRFFDKIQRIPNFKLILCQDVQVVKIIKLI